MRVSVDAAEGARIRFAVYSPEPIKTVTNGRGENLVFQWTPQTRLATFESKHSPGETLEMTFSDSAPQ